jgi:CubicO group peptidase (beta-lactamase class C family)
MNAVISKIIFFRLYATTKLISAVAVFQIIEKDKLSLKDKISKYFK